MIQLEEDTLELIRSQRIGRFATADAEGRPTVIPICYVFDGRDFYSAVDEKPKGVSWGRLKRLRNIEANPYVSLVVDVYDEDWSRLAYVLVHGFAEIVRPGGRYGPDHARIVGMLRNKYPQYRSMALEGRPLIRILPTRIKHWSASG